MYSYFYVIVQTIVIETDAFLVELILTFYWAIIFEKIVRKTVKLNN